MTIWKSPRPDIALSDDCLPDLVLGTAVANGDRAALIDAPSGRTVTFDQLATGIRSVAAGLSARGFGQGDVLSLHAPNLPEWPIAYYGAMLAGGAVTTSNPMYTADELAGQLGDARARFVVTIPPFLPQASAAASAAGCDELFVFGEADGATPFASLASIEAPPQQVACDPDRFAVLPYSSGTTGQPKGVMLTHRAIAANIAQSRVCIGVEPGDVVLGFLPFFHVMGQICVMATALTTSATIVTLPRFDLEQVLHAIQEYRVTVALVVPPVMNALARHPAVDRYDLSSLRLVGCGAAPLGAEIEAAVAARLGCDVAQGLGMTEASALIAGPALDPIRVRRGSSGLLAPNTEARIVDPAFGVDLGPGESGELWIRGPQVFAGYLNRPDATAETLTPEGWLRSGDVAHFDEDGFLFVTDRIKELIKVKGYQVAPAELEALLLTHPAVADACVIGRPDDEAGEVPVAYVVPAEDLDVDQLIEWVSERVATYKRLRAVEIVDDIPKSPSGKILRRLLRDRASVAASS